MSRKFGENPRRGLGCGTPTTFKTRKSLKYYHGNSGTWIPTKTVLALDPLKVNPCRGFVCALVLYRHIYAVKRTILSHISRPKVTLKTTAKVNKLDAGTPSCPQPPKPFSIVSMQYSQH